MSKLSVSNLHKLLSVRVLLPALLILTFLLYYPGLSGDFMLDDYANIVRNDEVHLSNLNFHEIYRTLNAGVASSLKRPFSMLSFGLNHYFTGLDPAYFKLTNVVIHLLCTFGAFLFTREVVRAASRKTDTGTTNSSLLALLVAACWALHPLNTSTVLYVVQRMTQLSTLTTLFTLYFYIRFRQLDSCPTRYGAAAFLGLFLLTGIGVLFKENAVLVIPFILLIEFFLFDAPGSTPGHIFFLRSFLGLLVAIPGTILLLVLVLRPELITGDYDIRNFTLWERFMTESRVLWTYIGWILMPDTRELHFYHDNFRISHSLLNPPLTLLAILGITGLLAFSVYYRKKLPLLCFGIAFFFAGHALESTVINLELAFEHRNYLPSLGLLLGLVYTLLNLPSGILRRNFAIIISCIYMVFLAHGTLFESHKWSNTYAHLLRLAHDNPGSHRANYALGFFYLNLAKSAPDNVAIYNAGSYYMHRAAEVDELAIRGHIGAILIDSQNNTPIEPQLVAALETRLQYNPLSDEALVQLSTLTECYYGNFCKFDKGILIRLYTAVANNEVSEAVTAQAILDQLATALITIFNNAEDGKAVLYLARDQRPILTVIDLKLIQLEIHLGNFVAANQLIAEGRIKQGTSKLTTELDLLAQVLTAREKAGMAAPQP